MRFLPDGYVEGPGGLNTFGQRGRVTKRKMVTVLQDARHDGPGVRATGFRNLTGEDPDADLFGLRAVRQPRTPAMDFAAQIIGRPAKPAPVRQPWSRSSRANGGESRFAVTSLIRTSF